MQASKAQLAAQGYKKSHGKYRDAVGISIM